MPSGNDGLLESKYLVVLLNPYQQPPSKSCVFCHHLPSSRYFVHVVNCKNSVCFMIWSLVIDITVTVCRHFFFTLGLMHISTRAAKWPKNYIVTNFWRSSLSLIWVWNVLCMLTSYCIAFHLKSHIIHCTSLSVWLSFLHPYLTLE